MGDEIRAVGPVERREDRRSAERRAAERRAVAESRALTVTEFEAEPAEPPARPAPTPASDAGATAFAAQMIGQEGQRRGLKGGPPVLDAARSTYLETRYSGADERRPRPGKAEDTDV
jgi:hypothetical protein